MVGWIHGRTSQSLSRIVEQDPVMFRQIISGMVDLPVIILIQMFLEIIVRPLLVVTPFYGMEGAVRLQPSVILFIKVSGHPVQEGIHHAVKSGAYRPDDTETGFLFPGEHRFFKFFHVLF